MRALQCKELGTFDNLALETLDDPVPGEGEVLVDVKAAALNFPDLLMIAGKYQARPPLPFVPGGECAGIVAALGPGVTGLAVGDKVVAMGLTGAFAEKMVIAAGSTLPLPKGMGFEAAAAVAIAYGTSYYALLEQAKLQAGETLLVLGAAGGVGLAAVALGKQMGARVIAAASSAAKLEAATAAGADEGIDYTSEPLKERIKALTDGRGADVIYDPVGGAYSEQALRAVAWNGRYLVVGFAAGDIPKIPLNLVLLKSAHLIGVFWGAWTERDPTASAQRFGELWKMFEDGRLTPKATAFPLAAYEEAFGLLAARQAVGKVVLVMDAD